MAELSLDKEIEFESVTRQMSALIMKKIREKKKCEDPNQKKILEDEIIKLSLEEQKLRFLDEETLIHCKKTYFKYIYGE